jgi:acetyl esterase
MPLDPQMQYVLDLIAVAGRPPVETVSVAEARELYRQARAALTPPPPEVAAVADRTVPGPAAPIPVRVYRPLGSKPKARLPALVYFHGGGWTIGDLDTHDVVCRGLANRSDCAVVSVDYRMGPEHRFPAAVEDCWAATRWLAANGAEIGVEGSRLAVGGDSAGGNLATVVALLARDAGAPRLAAQILFYPATEMAATHASHERFAEGYVLTRAAIIWFRDNYLRGPGDIADWRASPLRAASLAGLPPALVITAGYDPLKDEGKAYAERMAAAGVEVVYSDYPGLCHGFVTMGRVVDAAHTAIGEAAALLKRVFKT